MRAGPVQGGSEVRHVSKSSWWRGAAGATMTAAALSLVLSACSSNSGSGSPGSSSSGGGAAASPSPVGPKVTITPDTGAKHARPDRGITVTADGGPSATDRQGRPGQVEGSLHDAKTQWHSQWALSPHGTR
jgi:hypothetical protein